MPTTVPTPPTLPCECPAATAKSARFRPQARTRTSTWAGDPGYGQLARGTDVRILGRGPDDEAMGAFGFLREASKWANLGIRLREFMPVGIRPLLLPIT